MGWRSRDPAFCVLVTAVRRKVFLCQNVIIYKVLVLILVLVVVLVLRPFQIVFRPHDANGVPVWQRSESAQKHCGQVEMAGTWHAIDSVCGVRNLELSGKQRVGRWSEIRDVDGRTYKEWTQSSLSARAT